MDNLKKIKRNSIIFILLIVLTFYILLKDQNMSEVIRLLLNVKKEYILIGILCMCAFMVCEALNIGRTLKVLSGKRSFIKNIKYAMIGFFFSSITPAASGGQPMQVYYMHKDNISISHSTLSALMELLSSQIVTIVFSIIGIIVNYEFLYQNLNNLIYAVFLGLFLNLLILFFLFVFIFSKRISTLLIRILIKLLRFFRLKKIAEIEAKLEDEISTYHESAGYIKKHKKVMLKIILTACIQMIVYYSIPYWVYCSFGFTGYNIFEFITLQAVLYTTVSALPLPGAVGISESAFLIIYKVLFPTTILSSAMLLNRGISFYIPVLITGSIIAISSLINKIENNKISNSVIE